MADLDLVVQGFQVRYERAFPGPRHAHQQNNPEAIPKERLSLLGELHLPYNERYEHVQGEAERVFFSPSRREMREKLRRGTRVECRGK